MASTNSFVDMSTHKERLWLVKVPQFLAEHWQSAGITPGVSLGTIAPSEGGTGSGRSGQSFTLRLSDEAGYPPELPREYAMNVGAPTAPMYVLSRADNGKSGTSSALEGKVDRKGEVRLGQLSQSYKQLVAARTERAAMRPEVQIYDGDDQERFKSLKRKGEKNKTETSASIQKRQPRAEMPREQLLDVIFAKFAEEKYWHRKDLMEETGQKQNYLTEVLEQVAERVRFGKNKGEYQLKSEYRTG